MRLPLSKFLAKTMKVFLWFGFELDVLPLMYNNNTHNINDVSSLVVILTKGL